MHAYDARPLRLDLSTPTSTSSTTSLRASAAAAAAGPLSSTRRPRDAVLERTHEHGQATSSRSQSSQDAAACAGCAGGHSDDDDCRRRRRRRPRERQAGGALLLALAIYAQAPSATASPIPESAASPSRLAGDHRASPTVALTGAANFSPAAASSPLNPPAAVITHAPRPRLRERGPNIPPLYVNSDGAWVQDYGWTLRGRMGTPVNPASTGASTAYATAMEDHIPTSSPTSATAGPEHTPDVAGLGVDAGALSSAGSTFSSTPTSTAATSSSSSPSISIPNGWQAIPRETNYYAVPLVIAMSVLVAVLVAISIFISVIVRRKKRRRRKAAAARKARRLAAANGTNPTDLDGTNEMTEKGWRGALEKVTGRQARRKKRTAKRAATRAAAGAGAAVAGERTEGEEEGSAGRAPSVRRRVRVTGFTAAGLRGSLRRRRRRNGDDGEEDGRGGGDVEEEEDERALTRSGTRSSTASVVEDTLTHRVATRLSSSASGQQRGAGTTTVFSRDAGNGSVISLTASALDRVGSRSSRRSTGAGTSSSASIRSTSSALLPPPPPPHPAPEFLFTPADDPTLPDHLAIPGSPHHPRPSSPRPELSSMPPPITSNVSPPAAPTTTAPPPVSAFGAMIATDSLPAPGPPAYRPSSSTVQRTRRFADPDHATTPSTPGEAAASRLGATRRRLRRQRRESEGTSTERGPRSDDNDEGEWHWPGEKGRPLAASSASTSADPFVEEAALAAGDQNSAEEDDTDQNEAGALPPIDRSLFSAHVATDDKAVLARLRRQRERSPFVLDDEEADVGMMAALGSSAFVPVATSVPMASAPPVADDADLDEDGFERYDVPTPTAHGQSSSTAAGKVAASPMSSLLPAPPQRVHQVSLPNAFTPASSGADLSSASSTVPLLQGATAGDERSSSYFPRASTSSTGKAREAHAEVAERQADAVHDEEDLPMYLPGSTGATEALRMASAPVDADDHFEGEDDDDDGDGGDSLTPFDRGDEREEEGIV